MVSAVANDGKSAEGYITDALKLLERNRKSTFIRLYDSRSAGFGNGGNLVPPQPADFIFVLDGLTSLLEVKSSDRYKSLTECTVRNIFSEEQMLGAKLWTRAGNLALTAFYSLVTKQFEIWSSMAIRDAYLAPPRQRKLQGVPLASSGNSEEGLMKALAFSIKQ